ncbi:MAG: uroporphyrinogen decarboxylase [Alphaproteobacteria bacterium]|nr:uroporphyrinogen decarboxylase [Alphaproteobacteria bacterium]
MRVDKTRKPLLDVLRGEVPERLPIWLMRQAGRYLPEYRDLRAKSKNFLNMCLTPALATEITMQPIRRFGMDGAILFADILLIPMALGLSLDFREGEGPVLQRVASRDDLMGLTYNPDKVLPVFETVRRVKNTMPEKTALIGFCGAPWTVACYMIDGNSKNDFTAAKEWVREKPQDLDALIAILIDASEKYLSAQIEAGAEAVQIFDSWAGLISGDDFTRFIIGPTRELVSRIKKNYPDIPIIGFPREAGDDYEPYIRQTGVDALSIDTKVDIQWAKRQLQPVKPLQGNLDPDLLVRGGEDMKNAARHIISTLGPRHIFNLGHGVVPQTPPEHVAELVSIIRNFSA